MAGERTKPKAAKTAGAKAKAASGGPAASSGLRMDHPQAKPGVDPRTASRKGATAPAAPMDQQSESTLIAQRLHGWLARSVPPGFNLWQTHLGPSIRLVAAWMAQDPRNERAVDELLARALVEGEVAGYRATSLGVGDPRAARAAVAIQGKSTGAKGGAARAEQAERRRADLVQPVLNRLPSEIWSHTKAAEWVRDNSRATFDQALAHIQTHYPGRNSLRPDTGKLKRRTPP